MLDDKLTSLKYSNGDKMSSMMANVDFATWLQGELDKRELSQSDLARLSGLNRQVISTYINRQRTKPDSDMLNSIARALKLSPDEVFRAAGILPPQRDADPWVSEQTYRIQGLTGARRSMAERLLKSLEEEEQQAAEAERASQRKPRTV
jgi:transcriptional regulator with XRE-family HTH domain